MNVSIVLEKLKNDAQELLKRPAKLQSFIDKVIAKSQKSSSNSLKSIKEDLQRSTAMLKDYATGNYRQVPWSSIVSLLAGLIYFLNPLDLIPDFIPLKGLVDDATVMLYVLHAIKGDLDQYQTWQESKED